MESVIEKNKLSASANDFSDSSLAKDERGRKITKYVLITISVLFILLMLVLPLVSVVINSLKEGLAFYFKALSTQYVLSALGVTFLATVIAVLVNTFFGLVASYLLTKFNFKGKNVLSTLIDIPFSISPVIAGLSFIMTFGRSGWAKPIVDSIRNCFKIN